MKTADFNYHLPQHLIAQEPLEQRDASRLLVLNRALAAIYGRATSSSPTTAGSFRRGFMGRR
jgi:S-adenosylmethionine:tRNA-ribosyltransferase-isomerase (queuine synthetase)